MRKQSTITRIQNKGRKLRLVVIGLLAILLLIPLGWTESVVSERHHTYQGVLREISGMWSGEQTLTGPLLVVPFTERFQKEEEYRTNTGERKTQLKWVVNHRRAVVLPQELEVEGHLEPETRKRGIYEAKVYQNKLKLKGLFKSPKTSIEGFFGSGSETEVHWKKAIVVVGLTEPKGIGRIEALDWQGQVSSFSPGTRLNEDLLARGFHAPVSVNPEDSMSFALEFVVRGSEGFRLTPVGERSRITIESSWPHPSFYGDLLPNQYETSPKGFTAHWDLSHLIRSYPQIWVEGEGIQLGEVTSGVRIFEPVTLYAKVTRSVKYGFLFIALTFLTLGLMELVQREKISYIQYLLIGSALALFFMILVAFGEHLGFHWSYLIASVIVICLNGLYSLAVLPRKLLAAMVTGVLTGLYAILYVILQAEDYALLGGTLLLVVALALTMFFTRNLHLDSGEDSSQPQV